MQLQELPVICGRKYIYVHIYTFFSPPLSLSLSFTTVYIQEAAKRCKKEFGSSSEEKSPKWIISDGSSEPKLLTEHQEEGEDREKQTGKDTDSLVKEGHRV